MLSRLAYYICCLSRGNQLENLGEQTAASRKQHTNNDSPEKLKAEANIIVTKMLKDLAKQQSI